MGSHDRACKGEELEIAPVTTDNPGNGDNYPEFSTSENPLDRITRANSLLCYCIDSGVRTLHLLAVKQAFVHSNCIGIPRFNQGL